jgi:hypothetical protein
MQVCITACCIKLLTLPACLPACLPCRDGDWYFRGNSAALRKAACLPYQVNCTVQAVLCLLLHNLNMHIRFRVIVLCCRLKKIGPPPQLVFSCHGLKTLCIGGLFHFYVRCCWRVSAYYPCTSDCCGL